MSADAPAQTGRSMVIVTGAGRSGTSSMAGALAKLGFHVPLPEVQANAANPRGHFEPRWVVNFHARLLAASDVFLMDARPQALELATEVGARPRIRSELATWLEQAFVQPRLVIKDPRAFWFRDLWVDAAQSVGADLSFVTMLRHPAESVDSRLTHYMKDQDPAHRAARGTTHLAGWINATLVNERTSRTHRRAFVQYTDLVQDWRSTMRALRDTLALTYDSDLSVDEPHAIDDFIDPALHRVKATWEDLDLPAWLQAQGEDVWQALSGDDPTVQGDEVTARLDELAGRYAASHSASAAVASDDRDAAVRVARRETRKKVAAEHERARLEEAERLAAEQQAKERAEAQRLAAPATSSAPATGRRLGSVAEVAAGGRRLARRVPGGRRAGAALRRLRPR